jgi:hypothetical protein
MLGDEMDHRVIERATGEVRRAARVRRPRLRDSLATLLLGTLALGLGLVTLGATLAGIAGIPLPPWNEPSRMLAEATPRRYMSVWDPELGENVWGVKMVVAATILVPSRSCVGLALLGAVLGLAGFVLAIRRRRLSPVSMAGLVAGCACPGVGVAYAVIMNLLC